MDISLEMNAEQTLRVSPTLIAVNQRLALSSLELQAAIKQEADENPALEIQERQTCNFCGEVLMHGVCAACSRRNYKADPRSNTGGDYSQDMLPEPGGAGGFSGLPVEDDFDPVALVAAEPTMRERLMNDLSSALPSSEHVIAEYLVGNLDERGFLM